MLFKRRLSLRFVDWMKWNVNCVLYICKQCIYSILGFLKTQAEKAEVILKPIDLSAPVARARTHQEITDIESQLSLHEARILQMNNSKETLNKRFLELTELKHVLKETATFFDEV